MTSALAIAAEWLTRQEQESEPAYLASLFPEQRAFVEDTAKKKAALCSRRAGKTEGVAAWLLDGGATCPGGLSVYIARTRNNCRLILWRTLEDINRRHELGLWFREIDGQLMVELPNKHRIWLAGCKDSSEVDKFRGIKPRRVAIDEAQSYGSYLTELVFDVLEPSLLDLDGELVMTGTPSPTPAGLFYASTTGDGGARWSTHHWTVLDNPYVPHAASWLAQKRGDNQWDESHPTYRREWLGEWVRDASALVYPYDGARNAYYELPQEDGWYRVIGVDLGYEDSTAFVVVAARRGHPEVYIERSWKRSGLIPSAVAAHLERLRGEVKPMKIVADTGGLGKGYVEEFRQRYGIAVDAAEKRNKLAYAEMLRGEFLSGQVRVQPMQNRELLDELAVLQFTEDRSSIDDRFEDHLADALLYAWRACRAYYHPEVEGPKPGTREHIDAEMAKLKAEEAAKIRAEARKRVKRGALRLR